MNWDKQKEKQYTEYKQEVYMVQKEKKWKKDFLARKKMIFSGSLSKERLKKN